MIKKRYFSGLVILLLACNQQTDTDNQDAQLPKHTEHSDKLLQRAENEIRTKMGIPPSEKIKLNVVYEHLNGDDVKDAVITLNRLDFAKKEAAASPNGLNKKAYGYMGNYNFFFIYDGQSDRISVPMNIASSALSPLRVSFQNIQTEAYKDVVVEYRIRNSAFRNYYLNQDGRMSLMFQWKAFDQVGNDLYEANFITFDKGSYSLAKDILIYKGKIKNYNTSISDVYSYEPVIERDGDVLYRFFYDPKGMKYMTTQQPGEPLSQK